MYSGAGVMFKTEEENVQVSQNMTDQQLKQLGHCNRDLTGRSKKAAHPSANYIPTLMFQATWLQLNMKESRHIELTYTLKEEQEAIKTV